MLCRDVEQHEIAEKYLRGQLDSAAQDEFELHILDCSHCLASVELLQAVGEDLAARAPEIRSHTSQRAVRLRWSWVAVAAFSILAVIAVLVPIRKLFPGHDTKNAQSEGTAITKPETTEALHDKGPEDVRVVPPKETIKAATHGNSGTTGPAASQGSQAALMHDHSHAGVEPQGIASGDTPHPVPNERIVSEAPQTPPPPVLASSQKPNENPKLLSDEGEKELFRLALVNPPPYTFSGFTRFAKDTPSGLKSSGVRPGETKAPDGKRPAFQNAMLTYVEGNYERAGELLALALKQEPPAPDTYFFFGVCRLLQRDAAGSIAPFKSALADGASPFTQSAHYYLAKAYLQTHDLAAAETELQAAASLKGEWTGSARVELARLRALRTREGR